MASGKGLKVNNAESFQMHPQLVEDCHVVGRLQDCHVLLHCNAAVPWFILVPEADAAELLDLPTEQRDRVMEECALVGRFIRQRFQSPKLNFGALGNLVPQLHLHVIGRHPEDPCWPNPVWGNLQVSEKYSPEEQEQIKHELEEFMEQRVRKKNNAKA